MQKASTLSYLPSPVFPTTPFRPALRLGTDHGDVEMQDIVSAQHNNRYCTPKYCQSAAYVWIAHDCRSDRRTSADWMEDCGTVDALWECIESERHLAGSIYCHSLLDLLSMADRDVILWTEKLDEMFQSWGEMEWKMRLSLVE
jgi:hypothetical protein